ncbi:MAG TPA: acetylglutamate kinase [Candidatus Xenobia bacterium]|nr:acetylglutamate kinase [Candidatus Xenobia bacterium]
MRLVLKLGGAALDDAALLARFAQTVAGLARRGHQVAVVHGGGRWLTRTLERLGKKSEFIDGLRVTDAETRDVALMVLAGHVNKKLVAALAGAGQAAVGLCGGDGLSFRARKRRCNGRDLGFVGEVSTADARWMAALWAGGAVPVLASLALGADGEYYNINADQMAAACALACRAETLVFLTDVPGVWNAEREVIRRLSAAEISALAAGAVIRGGMLPKLDACRQALAGGVARVQIVPARSVKALLKLGGPRPRVGTEVVAA